MSTKSRLNITSYAQKRIFVQQFEQFNIYSMKPNQYKGSFIAQIKL